MYQDRFTIKARVRNERGTFDVWIVRRNVAKHQIPEVVTRTQLACRGAECWRVPERS